MRMHFRWWLMVLLVVMLAACTPTPAAPAPAKIHYGETMCAVCGRIINEPKFAGSIAVEESPGRYQSLPFDDIGDIVGDRQLIQALAPAATAMAGEADGVGGIAGVGEKRQEVLVPAPGAGEGAMDEQQGYGFDGRARHARQHFEILETALIHDGARDGL